MTSSMVSGECISKKTSGTLTEPLSSKRDFGMIWGEMSPSCLGDTRKMSTLTTAPAFFAYVITRAVHTLRLVIIKWSHFPLFSCNNTSYLKCQQFSTVLHFYRPCSNSIKHNEKTCDTSILGSDSQLTARLQRPKTFSFFDLSDWFSGLCLHCKRYLLYVTLKKDKFRCRCKFVYIGCNRWVLLFGVDPCAVGQHLLQFHFIFSKCSPHFHTGDLGLLLSARWHHLL